MADVMTVRQLYERIEELCIKNSDNWDKYVWTKCNDTVTYDPKFRAISNDAQIQVTGAVPVDGMIIIELSPTITKD